MADKAGDASVTAEIVSADKSNTEQKLSSSVLQRTVDTRHFQKTRSFSIAEDTPKKKVPNAGTNELKEFPFKDVSHSRSEQLGIQPKGEIEQDDEATPMNSKTCLLVTNRDGNDNEPVDEILAKKCSQQIYGYGETLIMQFDYDQPMSLQHETQYNQTIDEGDCTSLRQATCGSSYRKSGRDLTEFEAEATRDRFEKNSKNGRSNSSRPRLDFIQSYKFIPCPNLTFLCFSFV